MNKQSEISKQLKVKYSPLKFEIHIRLTSLPVFPLSCSVLYSYYFERNFEIYATIHQTSTSGKKKSVNSKSKFSIKTANNTLREQPQTTNKKT